MNVIKLSERQKVNLRIILGISLNCDIGNITINKVEKNNNNINVFFNRDLTYTELRGFNQYFNMTFNKSKLQYVLSNIDSNISIKLILPNNFQVSFFDAEYKLLKDEYESKIMNRFIYNDFMEHFMETLFPLDSNERSYVFYFASYNNYIGYANVLSESKCLKSYDGTIPSEALIFKGTPNDAYLACKKRSYNSSLNIDWKFLEVNNIVY